MVVLFGICESCSNAIKLDEKKRLFLSLQTVGYDAGDPEPGQGRAAAVCSPAERSLDAVEGQYAESWLLVRHFAPTAMMAGGGFLPTDISCSIKLLEHQTIKKRGATQPRRYSRPFRIPGWRRKAQSYTAQVTSSGVPTR